MKKAIFLLAFFLAPYAQAYTVVKSSISLPVPVSVKQCDAKGDGVTDDTANINSCIKANRTVFFPPGNYYINTSRGIQINVSSVNVVLDAGARVLVGASAIQALTINNVANSTITNININGLRITNTVTGVANAGILIGPDNNEVVNNLHINDFIIDGMGQYGITGGAIFHHWVIENGWILNNGDPSACWISQAYDVFPGGVGTFLATDFVMSNVYVEQTKTPACSAETDAMKVQNVDGVTLNNITAKGGGSSSVTGSILILSLNTNLKASNINLLGPANAGFTITTSTTGINTIDNLSISGTISSDSVYFGDSGTTKLTLDHLNTDGSLSGTGDVIHKNLVLQNSRFGSSVVLRNSTFTYSTIQNNTAGAAIQVYGSNNYILNNVSRNAGGDSFYIQGSSNVIQGNTSLNSGGYGFRIEQSSNVLVGNTVINPVSGGYVIGNSSYTKNRIGLNYGVVTISDSGSQTILPYISSVTAASIPVVTSGVYFDLISTFTLVAGNWELGGVMLAHRNGATFTATNLELCIGTAPGASATGCTDGQNYLYTTDVLPTNFSHYGMSSVHHHVTLTADTNFYLKAQVRTFTAGNPKLDGQLWAQPSP